MKLDRLPVRMAGALAALLILCLPALAVAEDFLLPPDLSVDLAVGGNLTITKTVIVSAAPATNDSVDVFFLFDSAGSMAGGDIQAATAAANAILAGVDGMGDLAYGVGSYVDFPVQPYGSPGVPDPYFPTGPDSPFTLVQDFSSNATATSNAIDSLPSNLGFGADLPGSQLHALDQVTSTTSWREDSNKIVVWFGDTPGHDGDLEPGYPSPVGLGDAIAALGGEQIVVEAIDLDGLDDTGQATAIASATGGDLLLGAAQDSIDAVIETIKDAINTAPTYSQVELEIVGDTDNTDVVITPSSIVGDFDRSQTEFFEFDLSITGVSEGVDQFQVRALVDGEVVAVENDTVTVSASAAVPEPNAVTLFGLGSLLVTGALRRRALR